MCDVIADDPQLKKKKIIKVSAKSKWKHKSLYCKTKRKALTFGILTHRPYGRGVIENTTRLLYQ